MHRWYYHHAPLPVRDWSVRRGAALAGRSPRWCEKRGSRTHRPTAWRCGLSAAREIYRSTGVSQRSAGVSRGQPGSAILLHFIQLLTAKSRVHVRSLYYSSLAIHGPQLFNSIPATIRNMTDCSVDISKRYLAKYLRMFPAEPQISGYTAWQRADSNSLFDMAQFASAQLVSTLEEPDQSVARVGHLIP